MPHGSHRLGFLSFRPHVSAPRPLRMSHTTAISSRHKSSTNFSSDRDLVPFGSGPPPRRTPRRSKPGGFVPRAPAGGARGARGAKNCDSGAGPGFRCGAGALSSPFSGIPGQNAHAFGDPSVSGEPGRAASSSSVRSTGAEAGAGADAGAGAGAGAGASVRWRFAAGAASSSESEISSGASAFPVAVSPAFGRNGCSCGLAASSSELSGIRNAFARDDI